MSGAISASGLVSGLNWENIIRSLMQIERQPVNRIEDRIQGLEAQRAGVRDVRTVLTTLRNRAQDFRLLNTFDQFRSTSSEESVLTATASGTGVVPGSYAIEVIALANATSAVSDSRIGGGVNTASSLATSGLTTDITSGSFTINGVSFTVDSDSQSLQDVIDALNASEAGVTAAYDNVTDRIALTNSTPGDPSVIQLGASDDTSNLLSALALTQANQFDSGGGTTRAVSTRALGAVNPSDRLDGANLAAGPVTAGAFRINGVAITVDPVNQSLADVISAINQSDAGVSASYDASTDTVRVVSRTLGSRTIRFGSDSDTSNFLAVVNLDTATQTAGSDSQFRINGGETLTRNTNEVSDAVNGVTLNLLSMGSSTVTLAQDDDAVVEAVRGLLDAVNEAVTQLNDLVGRGGELEGDATVRTLMDTVRGSLFSMVEGMTGNYQSLLDIGVSTGDAFDSTVLSAFELDEGKLREALAANRGAVQSLFSNSSDTGIANTLEDYLNEAVSASGFLNERIRTNGLIDQQITDYNDRIARMEERLTLRETRLRQQFSRLEQLSAAYQQQNAALSGLTSGYAALLG